MCYIIIRVFEKRSPQCYSKLIRHTQFASGLDSKELKSMRDSVSSWSAEGSELKSKAGPSQPTRDIVGPSRGPAIGPVRVSQTKRKCDRKV